MRSKCCCCFCVKSEISRLYIRDCTLVIAKGLSIFFLSFFSFFYLFILFINFFFGGEGYFLYETQKGGRDDYFNFV